MTNLDDESDVLQELLAVLKQTAPVSELETPPAQTAQASAAATSASAQVSSRLAVMVSADRLGGVLTACSSSGVSNDWLQRA